MNEKKWRKSIKGRNMGEEQLKSSGALK